MREGVSCEEGLVGEGMVSNFDGLTYKDLIPTTIVLVRLPVDLAHPSIPQNQKLENFVSPKVSLWESKG